MAVQDSPIYSVTIHLGASSLSLLVTEKLGENERQIEYLEQPVPLARDVFRHGSVKRDTMERCVEILQSYLISIAELGLTAADVQVAAVTNIIDEALNHHLVLNRLQISSGIQFSALNNGSMTRLVFQKIQRRQEEAAFTNAGNTLALHVGPGNTRALLMNEGKVERYATYRLGTHRTAEALQSMHNNGDEYLQSIRGHCEAQVNAIKYDFRRHRIDHMILIGYEIQQVARMLGDADNFAESIETYSDFLSLCSTLTEEERVLRFNLDYHSEDAFLPALQINYSLLHAFEIQRYWIPTSEYEKGLLSDLAMTQTGADALALESLHSARLLAQYYEADSHHYNHVLKLVETLFEQTREIHGLKEEDLHLLKVATIVHEVGGYISPRMHHKHSAYLIKNSEIFGMDERHLNIVALIARYHRKSTPKTNHKDYTSLSEQDQILVSKLAALLRVADALDVAQQQRIKFLVAKQERNTLILSAEGGTDIDLERLALDKKGDLFEQLFGLELKLKHVTQFTV